MPLDKPTEVCRKIVRLGVFVFMCFIFFQPESEVAANHLKGGKINHF
jgi:hypothetical protein